MITFGERFDSKTIEHLTPKLIIPPWGDRMGAYITYTRRSIVVGQAFLSGS